MRTDMERKTTYPKTSTPWGQAQTATKYGRGVVYYSTAGHGGFHLSPKMNAEVPDYLRTASAYAITKDKGWYEEDCEWAFVAVSLPDLFTVDEIVSALDTIRGYYPDAYEKFTGLVLKPGESYARDEANFLKAHANDYLVLAAYGDWHKDVPKGMVGILAGRGGRDNGRLPADQKWFVVPAAEYDAVGGHWFKTDEQAATPAPVPVGL